MIGDDEVAVGQRQDVGGVEEMRAGGGEGCAVGGGGGAIAGDGGHDARGINAADALVVRIGEVEIAFGIERDVAGLLEAARVALVLQVGERERGVA